MLQKFAGPIVEAPFCGAAPVRPNMLNMPKSASVLLTGRIAGWAVCMRD